MARDLVASFGQSLPKEGMVSVEVWVWSMKEGLVWVAGIGGTGDEGR